MGKAFVLFFTIKRFKISSFSNLDQHKIEDIKLNITNKNNIKDDFQTWFFT